MEEIFSQLQLRENVANSFVVFINTITSERESYVKRHFKMA